MASSVGEAVKNMKTHWKFSGTLDIDPQELKDTHNKIYTEKSLHTAVKAFQKENGLESFSEAGRALWLIAFQSL
jgi:hypothetical protein